MAGFFIQHLFDTIGTGLASHTTNIKIDSFGRHGSFYFLKTFIAKGKIRLLNELKGVLLVF